jgi:hypothetical protein
VHGHSRSRTAGRAQSRFIPTWDTRNRRSHGGHFPHVGVRYENVEA